MKILFITLGAFIGIVSAFYIAFMPVANHFVRYLWWRLNADVSSLTGIVQSGGATIHYTVYGKGTPLLMLHGGLSNKLSWFSQIPQLAAAGYQLILLDSRGHGLSDLGNSGLNYRQMVDDSIAVLDRLKIENTDVIGWSDGANTALLLATLHPEKVGKIVAISGNYSPAGLTPKARQENVKQSRGVRYWLYRLWTGAGEKFQELEKRLKSLWNSGPVLSLHDLEGINTPVLVIIGGHDLISVSHAQEMGRLLPVSTLVVIEDGGHSTLITHADEVNRLIREFFADTGTEVTTPAPSLPSH